MKFSKKKKIKKRAHSMFFFYINVRSISVKSKEDIITSISQQAYYCITCETFELSVTNSLTICDCDMVTKAAELSSIHFLYCGTQPWFPFSFQILVCCCNQSPIPSCGYLLLNIDCIHDLFSIDSFERNFVDWKQFGQEID